MADSFPIAFGRYQLVERLAVGGMAEIFLARAPGAEGFERTLVIKRLLPHLATDPHHNSMFIDEAKLTARLVHPKIAQTFELGRHDGQLFITMEFVDGIDVLGLLRECAHQRKRLRPEIVLYIICEVLDALDFAHGQADDAGNPLGIVHRDISPSNILLSRRGAVKLVDFGIARATEQGHKTGGGTLKGKYGYMSPEQVMGEPLDARADVFAVGIVLAEMLMGRRLFAAPNELDVLLMVRDADLTRLDRLGGHIDTGLGEILRRALRKNIAERYQSAADFHDALDQWLYDHRLRVTHKDIAALVASLYDSAWARKRQAMAEAADIVARAGDQAMVEAQVAGGEIDGIPSGELNAGDSLPISIEPLPVTRAPSPIPELAPDPEPAPEPVAEPAPAPAASSPGDLSLDLDLDLDLEPLGAQPVELDLAPSEPTPPPPATPTEAPATPALDPASLGQMDLAGIDLELDLHLAPSRTHDLGVDIDLDDDADEAATPAPVPAAPERKRRLPPSPPPRKRPVPNPAAAPGDIGREIDNELARRAGRTPAVPATAPTPDEAVPTPLGADESVRYASIADAVASVSKHEPDPAAQDFDGSEVSDPRARPNRAGRPVRVPTADELAGEPPPSPPPLSEISEPPDESGDLARTSPIRVLYRLIVNRATGLLVVGVGGIRKEIYLADGVPVFVRSNVRSELFGEYLVARRAISEGELAMALAMMPHYGGKLGDTLVGLELLTPLDVFRQLSRQVRDKLIDYCTWSKGSFAWYHGREQPPEAFPLDILPYAVLGAGVMAIPEQAISDWGKRHGEARPHALPCEHFALADLDIGAEVEELHASLDGSRTIANLSAGYKHMVDRQRFLRTLFLLVEIDLVTLEA